MKSIFKHQFKTHNSLFTQAVSWIVRVRTALAVRFQAVLQLGHSLRLSALTGWVRYAHTAPYRKSAFTLAETLIVIGIIGVVAALTLPNLNHATGDKEKVTRVKKIYSSLTDAFDRAQVIYGPADEWFKDLDDYNDWTERAAKRITEFMKVSKDCGFNEGCWSTDSFKWPNGGTATGDSYVSELENWYYMVNLSDGTSLAFLYTEYIRIKVDIDGYNKGKTQMGDDLFEFKIGIDHDCKSHPICKTNELTPDGIYEEGPNDYNGFTRWVVENGNLDYLKCPDDLDWETQTSCK